MTLRYSKFVFDISVNFTCEVYFTNHDDIVNVTYYELGTPILFHSCKKIKHLSVKDYARKYLREFYLKVNRYALQE